MRLTTKGRYAVTAMLDLALNQHAGPISLSDISQRQDISLSYLEQLFSKLRRHELVTSVRGPGGGYRLGRTSAEISVANRSISVRICICRRVRATSRWTRVLSAGPAKRPFWRASYE